MTDHLFIWNALAKTDPAHTKKFTRAGGFKGTAISPIYMIKKMTEQFGPAGFGWGMGKPEFQVVPAHDETLVFCTVSVWWEKPSHVVYGVGGDFAIKKNKNGIFGDDEAFKKSYTDALSNAMKQIGVGADVHMGQHDDNKYVAELQREFSDKDPVKAALSDTFQGNGEKPKKDPLAPWKGPLGKSDLTKKLRQLTADLNECGDLDTLEGVLSGYQGVIEQLQVDVPLWWDGEASDGFTPLRQRIEDRRAILTHQPHKLLQAG